MIKSQLVSSGDPQIVDENKVSYKTDQTEDPDFYKFYLKNTIVSVKEAIYSVPFPPLLRLRWFALDFFRTWTIFAVGFGIGDLREMESL